MIPTTIGYEEERIRALHELEILDTDLDENFDTITLLLKDIFNVPIALVSLVDENRQWFKSCQGLDSKETDRDVSFCSNAISHTDDIYVIEDATKSDLYKNNPLVIGDPMIRFYAGKVIQHNGFRIGTVCVVDKKPKQFSEPDKQRLRWFGNIVESEVKKHYSMIQLNKNKQRMTKMTSVISHDMRNLIGGIVGLTDMILNTDDDSLDLDVSDIEVVNDNARGALKLSDDLMDACKISMNAMSIDKKLTNVNRIINKYTSLEYVTDPIIKYSGNVSVDPLRINQVFMNLITNAQEFVPKGSGKITIGCDSSYYYVTFWVQDNGIGIPMDQQHKLFTEFSGTLHPGIKKTNSTGLGLYNSKGIVSAHGGTMWLDKGYEDGAKFCFTIPL